MLCSRDQLRCRFVGQVQHGRENDILAPAIVARAWTLEVSLLRYRQVALAGAEDPERVRHV